MGKVLNVITGEVTDGPDAPPILPPPPPAKTKMSFSQLLFGLANEGWITEAEFDAWFAGTLPAPVLSLIATLPTQAARLEAKSKAQRPSEVLLTDGLVQGLAAAEGKQAEMQTFFNTYGYE